MRVLFVCTGNSARSIMAESLLRKHGGDDFEVFSAGTEPRGINPLTVRVLEEAGLPTTRLAVRNRSTSSWASHFDHVITMCDEARQACPVFPGSHESLHWGYEDPAAATGTDEERLAVFRHVFTQIGLRTNEFATIARRFRAGAHSGPRLNETVGNG